MASKGYHAANKEKVYSAIVQHKRANDGCPPTVRQLSKVLGMSLGAVSWHIAALRAEGRITGAPGKLQVTGGVWLLPFPPEKLDALLKEIANVRPA